MSLFSQNLDRFFNKVSLAQVFFVVVIVAANLSISLFLRNQGLFFVANQNPIGYGFGYYSSLSILVFCTWAVIKFDFLHKNPVYAILILAGLYSNFLEKIIFNNVADYLPAQLAYLNLADTQIFLGLLIMNFHEWLPKNKLNLEYTQSKDLTQTT
jgi:lipoprotein signal peptidase